MPVKQQQNQQLKDHIKQLHAVLYCKHNTKPVTFFINNLLLNKIHKHQAAVNTSHLTTAFSFKTNSTHSQLHL